MNDLEEVSFGIVRGSEHLLNNQLIKGALKTKDRYDIFFNSYTQRAEEYSKTHLLDTYVLCFSEHQRDNTDGILSMWRGYGDNGKGAAIVLDASKIEPVEDSPLLIYDVEYASQEERIAWFERLGSNFAGIINRCDIPDDQLYLASHALFERLKIVALLSKHDGFDEEKEWRIIYMCERDFGNRLADMCCYSNSPSGIELKLKFQVKPIDGVSGPNLSFETITENILLGPSRSSPLDFAAVGRMLERIGKPALKNRLITSSIPFRPT